MRGRERGLVGAHQSFDRVRCSRLRIDDRLEHDPQLVEGAVEANLETGSIEDASRAASRDRERLSPDLRERICTSRLLHEPGEHGVIDRLGQEPKRAVLDGGGCEREIRCAGHQDHGDIQVDSADRPEQVETGLAGHVDVGDDHVEARSVQFLDGLRAGLGLGHLEFQPPQETRLRPSQQIVIVRQEDPFVDPQLR